MSMQPMPIEPELPIKHQSKPKTLKPMRMQPLDMQEMPEEVREALEQELLLSQQPTDSPKEERPFTEKEIKEMELVFEYSPRRAQRIVTNLQDPAYLYNPNFRAAFFIGEPGTGKTMMAKAIAHKMSLEGWEYRFRTSTSFLGEYRNQTAMNLQKELNSIKASNKPTILIIDELTLFLNNTESKYHDTKATSNVLWNFLDGQKDNPNFFLIGTLQYSKRLSQSSKDKIDNNLITFPLFH